jgi:dienelactone hydrolase
VGEGPLPALVRLQGSGNTDRDSALGPNKIFRDIARYNKRPNEHPETFAQLAGVTVKEEVVDDAVSACARLRATSGIDAKHVFALGHSLGGTVAPASYWLDMRDYHPEPVASTLRLPMMILQGERDYQVPMEDFRAWKKALAGRGNVAFRSYAKLNHMFMEGEGVSSDEEYLKPGHVSERVVEDVAGWAKAQ